MGKTTLSKPLRPDWLYTDLEKPSDYNRVHSDPELFLSQTSTGVIIDKAQLIPNLFNALRARLTKIEKAKVDTLSPDLAAQNC